MAAPGTEWHQIKDKTRLKISHPKNKEERVYISEEPSLQVTSTTCDRHQRCSSRSGLLTAALQTLFFLYYFHFIPFFVVASCTITVITWYYTFFSFMIPNAIFSFFPFALMQFSFLFQNSSYHLIFLPFSSKFLFLLLSTSYDHTHSFSFSSRSDFIYSEATHLSHS